METAYNDLMRKLLQFGERLPKKHGEWRRLKVFGNEFLLLDTWNGAIANHEGCESTGPDNLYRVVYTFTGYKKPLKVERDFIFWLAHLGKFRLSN